MLMTIKLSAFGEGPGVLDGRFSDSSKRRLKDIRKLRGLRDACRD